jgi:hypothetical protein
LRGWKNASAAPSPVPIAGSVMMIGIGRKPLCPVSVFSLGSVSPAWPADAVVSWASSIDTGTAINNPATIMLEPHLATLAGIMNFMAGILHTSSLLDANAIRGIRSVNRSSRQVISYRALGRAGPTWRSGHQGR